MEYEHREQLQSLGSGIIYRSRRHSWMKLSGMRLLQFQNNVFVHYFENKEHHILIGRKL